VISVPLWQIRRRVPQAAFFASLIFASKSSRSGPFDVNWEADQISQKPESYDYLLEQTYYYNPIYGNSVAYYSLSQYVVTDMQEAKAMVARSRTHALGAQAGTEGVINSDASVDLVGAFGFGNTRDDHSAEFKWPIQTSLGYYQDILNIIQPVQ
jgi:hypothetical protein